MLPSASERKDGLSMDQGTGRFQQRVTVQFQIGTLSPPVLRLNTLKLVDGSSARPAWLYPVGYTGLVLTNHDSQVATESVKEEAVAHKELLDISDEQCPVLCLVPVDGSLDHLIGSTVDIVGKVYSADIAMLGQLLAGVDQIRLRHFSRVLRPFEEISTCLALDLRPKEAMASRISPLEGNRVVIGVQGVLEFDTPRIIDEDDVLRVVIDAIPDRSGMGPLRLISVNGEPYHSALSGGRIRWIYDNAGCAIGAYLVVDMSDREDVVRKTSELVHHWHVWQKATRLAFGPLLDN